MPAQWQAKTGENVSLSLVHCSNQTFMALATKGLTKPSLEHMAKAMVLADGGSALIDDQIWMAKTAKHWALSQS